MSRLTSPAAARNLKPITEQLRGLLPDEGTVLELASGPGEHATAFAREFSALNWQPTDVDPAALESIKTWRLEAQLANLQAPVNVDLTLDDWPGLIECDVAAIVAINVCHISPWQVSQNIIRGASTKLKAGGLLAIYGPFKRGGEHTASSNANFDASLRARDVAWGIRDVADLENVAKGCSMCFRAWHDMPSNNAILEFRRT